MFGEAMDYRYFNFSDGVAVNSNHRITLNKIKTAEKPPLPEMFVCSICKSLKLTNPASRKIKYLSKINLVF